MKRPRSAGFLVVVAAVVCVALPGAQGAQSPPPQTPPKLTFRATTNVVEIDAIVTDEKGAFVRGLDRADFVVTEDGKPQPLAVATLIDIPVERVEPLRVTPKAKPVEPDVVTNRKPVDGRVFMLVLDGFHVSAIRSATVKKQAKDFVEKYLGANDLAAVIHVGNPKAGQEFTSNRRLLTESIDRFIGVAVNSATYNLVQAARIEQDAPAGSPPVPKDVDEKERAYMARESIDSLGRVAHYLGGLRGRRKALVFFSEGIDVSTLDRPMLVDPASAERPVESGSIRLAQEAMVREAARANVSIYAVDPRGLATPADEGALVGMLPDSGDGSVAGGGLTDKFGDEKTVSQSAQDEINMTVDSLRTFAEQTGGIAFVSSNDFANGFQRILDDNSTYYLLGYTSPDPGRGKFHRVSVKVNRPGLRVRVRSNYYSPDDKDVKAAAAEAADPVRAMLVSPAPLGGLGMRAHTGVVRTPEGKGRVHLTVEFNGQDVPLTPQNNVFVNDVEIGYYALDMTGASQSSGRHVMHLKLQPATRQAFPANGVRYVTEFDLPPGRYQVRLAAHERSTGREGSVFCDVDVPDYAKTTLTMSDLSITSSSASKTLTAQGSPPPGYKLPSQTTAAREFAAAETLTLFAGVYDREIERAHKITLTLTLTGEDGKVAITRADTLATDESAGPKGEFPYTLSVPLQGLTAGRYVLSVEARSSLGDNVARRDVVIAVK